MGCIFHCTVIPAKMSLSTIKIILLVFLRDSVIPAIFFYPETAVQVKYSSDLKMHKT